MKIIDQLKKFSEVACPCGKPHVLSVSDIIVGSGAIRRLPEIVSSYPVKKAFVLSDRNTFAAAGEAVCKLLRQSGIHFQSAVLSVPVQPDEKAVGKAVMRMGNDCDIVIGVGSGVINDIGKILSAHAKVPYVIVGTAPSMDGYASNSSSMELDGLKTSLPSKCADVIIGDTDILKEAPIRMLQAGLGDMLAKYISIAEWKIAHEITGEYYCERVAELIREALKKCVENADGLLKRDAKAVEAVFEGLILGGVAMAFAGVSRPASGCEHYFSHIWDMRGLEFGTKADLHGIQCAVATSVCAGIYERVKAIVPSKEKALRYVAKFDYQQYQNRLRAYIGKGAEAMIALEQKEGKYNPEKHAERLNILIEKWDAIRKIICEEIPEKAEIDRILDRIGAPKTVTELGIEGDLFSTFEFTKDIRDKYVLSRLLWDLGEIDDIGALQ